MSISSPTTMSTIGNTSDSLVTSSKGVKIQETTNDTSPPSDFMRLPLELRLQIYEDVLKDREEFHAHDLPSILHVSRQISSEILKGCFRERKICFYLHGQWARGDKYSGDEMTLDRDYGDAIPDNMNLNEHQCPGGDECCRPLSRRIDSIMTWLRALEPDAWGHCYAIEIVMSYWVLQNLVRVMDVEDLTLPKWRKDFWPEFCSLLPPKARFVFIDVLDGQWKDSTNHVNLLGNTMRLGPREYEDERKLARALDCSRAGWMKSLLPHFRELVELRVQLKYYFGFELDRKKRDRIISYKTLESIEENLARFNGMMKEKLAKAGARDIGERGILMVKTLNWY